MPLHKMIPTLSIAIPTYNRALPLQVCLESILRQNTFSISILVLDNCSEVPAEVAVNNYRKADAAVDIRIVRNACNIGSAANVLRCMEYASADYLWIIGDDDCLDPDAVANVLKTIAREPDLLAYNFSSGLYTHEVGKVVRGDAIFAEIPSFSNLLYVSATIFNLNKLRNKIPHGYQYAYSTGPHLAVLFASVKIAEGVGYFDQCIVRPQVKGEEARWSVLEHWRCIPLLAEVAPEERNRRDLLLQINKSFSIPLFLINHLVVGIVWKSSRRAFEHYRQCVWRHYRVTRGPLFANAAILLGWLVIRFRYLSTGAADIYLRQKGMKRMRERCQRFGARSDVIF